MTSKKIIVCADGTWEKGHGVDLNSYDTNVRRIYLALENIENQLVYYDSGVGTNDDFIDHIVDGITGDGLLKKIKQCYKFICDNYNQGDSIYLFGFSRGAYTVRSLAGMICRLGLLTKENTYEESINKVFSAYRNRSSISGLIEIGIELVGVWETVGSLGIPFDTFDTNQYKFLDTSLHPSIKKAYHAVSIDEKRESFSPTLWTNQDGTERPNDGQLEQVWFPGVHNDVGGGYVNGYLAQVTLSWMMQKGYEAGLRYNSSVDNWSTPSEIFAYGPIHNSWKFIPYGVAKYRKIPKNGVVSDSIRYLKHGGTNVDYDSYSKSGRIALVMPYLRRSDIKF